ncbi:SusC/RagA family TonB-linked outer membrane protein [Arachidicoccus sp.]|uniref:SusC/RagA family TonB-linked outer membrane protein n=1 Tax=Arachidicoccus sp. TaxID=1872624 RepID=UPI003D195CFD
MENKTLFAVVKPHIAFLLVLMMFFNIPQSDAQIKDSSAKTIFQQINITGTVHDNLNAILSGASVTNVRTGKSTLTNGSGRFTIEAAKGDSLKASYIGYQDYLWQFNNSLNYDIVLSATAGSLNDVVVTSFGQRQKRMSIVGAVSTVDVQELQHPVANLSTMLAGRIPGVIGVQRSGLPGSNSADIWIRGIQSFGNSPSGPLILVDGVQGRDIDSYDPEDIESFTVLKDAAATAMYGSLGANGVILITTKKGAVGKINLMAQYLQGFTQFTKTPKMADAGEYMNLKNEALIASGLLPSYTQDYIDSTLSPTANHFVYPNVDWIKQVFNNHSYNRKFTISARGGSESVRYYAALDYYDESSMIKTDPSEKLYNPSTLYKKYNFTSNVDMNWTKTTKFSLYISGYVSDLNQPDGTGSRAGVAFGETMAASPVRIPPFYPGNLQSGSPTNWQRYNPWGQATQTGFADNYTAQISSTLHLNQDLSFWLKGLSFNALYSFDTHNINYHWRNRTRSVWYLNQAQPYNPDGSLNLTQIFQGSDNMSFGISNDGNRQTTLQGILNYSRTFGDHQVAAMLAYNQLSAMSPFDGNYLNNFPNRTQNYAGKVDYIYKDKYMLEFNVGYNGSKDYAPDKRYGWFPVPAVGWIVSDEKFFKPLSGVFQYFKIRYSNGITGAPGTGSAFGYLTFVTTGGRGYTFGKTGADRGYSGVNISQYGANVQWAVAHTQDLGIDFHTANDHLQVVFDYWYSYRTKVFLNRQDFPDYAGLQYQPNGNYGTVKASGFDGQITLTPLQLGHNMTLGFNGTVTCTADRLINDDAPQYPFPYYNHRGQELLANFGYVAEGLFQSQAEINNSADQSALGNPRPGDIKYKDLNGDGVINQFDQTVISKRGDVPDWILGFGLNYTWGNFYVSAFFQGNEGSYRELSGIAQLPFNNADDGNLYAIASDHWTPENPNSHAFYPRLGYGATANLNNSVPSTWWVKNIGFIRFKTLDIGYNIKNTKWMQKMSMKNLQIYFDGMNLCYWSPFKMWDPEMNTGDGSTYPNTRDLSLGIRINF